MLQRCRPVFEARRPGATLPKLWSCSRRTIAALRQAKDAGEDGVAVVEREIGMEQLDDVLPVISAVADVADQDILVTAAERYSVLLRRFSPRFLAAFDFQPKAEGYCSRGDGRASPGRWARRNPWPRRHPCQCDFRRPKDRRSRPQQWKEAVDTLMDCLDAWQNWRDNLPAGVADSAVAERLDTILELRDLVEQLEAAELVPRVAHIAGYNLFSFTRASAVVKCQSALTCFLFRLSSQAATSSTRVSLSGIRRSRH